MNRAKLTRRKKILATLLLVLFTLGLFYSITQVVPEKRVAEVQLTGSPLTTKYNAPQIEANIFLLLEQDMTITISAPGKDVDIGPFALIAIIGILIVVCIIFFRRR